jgi:ribosomal protein L10
VKDLSDIAISAVAAAVQDLMEQEQKEAPFELGAPWTHHANAEELQRLAKLHSRIQRKKNALSALVG